MESGMLQGTCCFVSEYELDTGVQIYPFRQFTFRFSAVNLFVSNLEATFEG